MTTLTPYDIITIVNEREKENKKMENTNNKKTNGTRGIGFYGLLGIAFIVLKLCGVIDWSWIWVLAPIWGPTVLAIIFFIGCVVMGVIVGTVKKNKKNN